MDIEILIDYIQQKGFKIYVSPGILRFWKETSEKRCCYSWAISKVKLSSCPSAILFKEADLYMSLVNNALEETS